MAPWDWNIWLGSRLAFRAMRLALGLGVELRLVFRSGLLDRFEFGSDRDSPSVRCAWLLDLASSSALYFAVDCSIALRLSLANSGRPALARSLESMVARCCPWKCSDVAREQLVAAELGGGRSPVMSHLQ